MQKNHAGSTVKVSPTTKIATELQPRFVGGNPPDLIDNSGADAIGFSTILEQLEDLKDVLDANSLEGTPIRDTLFGGVEEPGTYDGKLAALNYVLTVYAVWYSASLFEQNAYRDYLELHGLSVQLTEALAELWHARIRADFGFATDDGPMEEMIRDQAYRGSRYSFGYPACPELDDRRKLMALLRPERIGVELSEELQLHPEQSTDAMIVHHPEAKYFNAR